MPAPMAPVVRRLARTTVGAGTPGSTGRLGPNLMVYTVGLMCMAVMVVVLCPLIPLAIFAVYDA